jgi:FHS family Na+ dependent glucose MFS transporter 1
LKNSNMMTKTIAETDKRSYTVVYYIAFVMLGLSTAYLGPALPSLADLTGSPLGGIGFLFTATSTGYMLGSLASGKGFDRLPGHWLVALGLLSNTVILFLAPLISQLWLLTLLLLILGLGQGALDTGANLLLVWVHRGRATPYLNGLHFFFGVGALIAPILVAQSLLRTGSVTAAFWLIALYPIPAALWMLRLPSPAPPHHAEPNNSQPVYWKLVGILTLVFLLYVAAEIGFGGWIYTFASEQGLGDVALSAFLTSAFWGALTLGRLLIIPFAARFSPERIVITDFICCLASISLVLLFPASYPGVLAGTIGLGLSMASIFPTLLAFAERHLPMRGDVTRWFFVGTGAGGMTLPWIIGQLFENAGLLIGMLAVLLDLIIGLVVFCLALKLARERSTVQVQSQDQSMA